MKKIIKKIKIFIVSLFFGLRKADQTISTNNSETIDSGSNIESQKESHTLYDKLLKGELTQEVKEFRYQVYKILRESEKFVLMPDGSMEKNSDGMLLKKPKVYETKDHKVTIVQENTIFHGGFQESIDNMLNDNKKLKTRIKTKLKDDYYPIMQIDRHIIKLVIKENNKHIIVDFYFNSDIDNRNKLNVLFSKEINKLKNGKNSFIREISNVEFVTENAYGIDQMFYINLKNLEFDSVNEYEKYSILTFKTEKQEYKQDLLAEFYSEEMETKYKNKEKKKNSTIRLE